MLVRALRALLVVALCCSPVVAQETRSWKGWTFQVPPGWTAQETSEAIVLGPGGSSANRVILFAPQPASGSLSQWFTSAVQEKAGALRGFRAGGQIKQAKTTGGAPTLYLTGQAAAVTGPRLVLSYLGMLTRNGQGLLMQAQFDQLGVFRNLRSYSGFLKTLEPGEAPVSESTQMAASNEGPLESKRSAVGRTNERQTGTSANLDLTPSTGPLPAKPNGHDLYDWFGSFYNSMVPGPNFTLSSIMVWEFYRFFPNGYLYEGHPSGIDPATINCTGPAQLKGGRCKHYTLSGNTLMIDGEKPHAFAMTSGGIKVDGTEKNRVRPASQPMSGTWKTSSGGGLGTTVTLSQHLLTLRPDGTFSIQGSTGVSGANVAAYNASASSGHYQLHGYTIEMDYNNGRTVKQSFLLPYPDDKVFLIGDSMYFVPSK